MKYAAAYGIALVIFIAIDALWLGVVARGLYMSRIGDLLLQQPRWAFAIVFYLLYVVGLTYFAIAAGIDASDWKVAALNGALFGFFCYLTYDATNLAVLRGYDPLIATIDTLWGTFLSGLAAALATVVYGWIAGR